MRNLYSLLLCHVLWLTYTCYRFKISGLERLEAIYVGHIRNNLRYVLNTDFLLKIVVCHGWGRDSGSGRLPPHRVPYPRPLDMENGI